MTNGGLMWLAVLELLVCRTRERRRDTESAASESHWAGWGLAGEFELFNGEWVHGSADGVEVCGAEALSDELCCWGGELGLLVCPCCVESA